MSFLIKFEGFRVEVTHNGIGYAFCVYVYAPLHILNRVWRKKIIN